MEWTAIIIALITATIGSSGIVTLYLKSRLNKAEKNNAQLKRIDAEIDVQKASCERKEMIYDDLLCRKINGEQMNGELKKALNDYKKEREELQRLYDERAAVLRQ